MISLKNAKKILGTNFIGPEEIRKINSFTNISNDFLIPEIPFDIQFINALSEEYLLVLGVDKNKNNDPLTLNSMREFYGVDPSTKEPCFYNQDWYLKEDFADKITLESKWYLVRKKIIDKTRGKRPDELKKYLDQNEQLPLAILTAYTFFSYYFLNKKKLWENDFIWCSDLDHNGDIIYTGRYIDLSGVNKNGFNIHRHLKIRPIYGAAPQLI